MFNEAELLKRLGLKPWAVFVKERAVAFAGLPADERIDANRGTGRTTKMMVDAIQLAAQGNSVVLIFHSQTCARLEKARLDGLLAKLKPLSFSSEAIQCQPLSWASHMLTNDNTVVLYDHYAGRLYVE